MTRCAGRWAGRCTRWRCRPACRTRERIEAATSLSYPAAAGEGPMRTLGSAAAVWLVLSTMAAAQSTSPNGVKTLSPEGAIKPTGTWSLGTRAGDFVFVAGMRGIDPTTNTLVAGDEARIRQAFLNMKLIAESEGASLSDAVRLVVYVTDMSR